MRRRDLATWGRELYVAYAPAIADLIGAAEAPPIVVQVERRGPGAAWTSGTDVFLSAAWFAEHPDDVGGCLHEFTHAIMRAPIYDATTSWLIEGIADWVRDELGHDAPWTFPHFEPAKATSGYQPTAHFLRWLERNHPGAVRELSQALMQGVYADDVFAGLTGGSLTECVSRYESDQTGA